MRFILTIISVSILSSSDACEAFIQQKSGDTVLLMKEINLEVDTIASKGTNILFLAEKKAYNSSCFLATYFDEMWHLVEVKDWKGYTLSAQLQLIRIDGVSDPLVYIRWKDGDWGSGSGTVMAGKMLWSFSAKRCYLDVIDKSTYFWRDKYGDNPSYKTFNYHHMCLMKVSKEGIEVTYNNTCEDKFKDYEGGEQVSYDDVAKVEPGFYRFKNNKWIKDI